MQIGTYYYPEQWPRGQWERDFDNMAGMGMQIVHMGEFAWFEMEPREGEVRLDWLSDAVELAASRGMKVILCTPTAVPPVWLVEKDIEVTLRDENGAYARHGGRRHGSPTSLTLIEATRRIVGALADRFAEHSAVIGWQIDNEYSAAFGQNEHTHIAFRQWLERKHQSIEKLNEAWGNQFWNTYYTDWSQILMPTSPRENKYRNPHHLLEGSRFWSWAFANFNRVQTDILRPRIRDRFLTTNYMPFHPDCDPGDMAPDFNLMSWDSYPVTGWEKEIRDETWRIADPAGIGIMHDIMGSYFNRFAMMEVQPGQVNWSGVPVRVYPGAVRLWLWTAFAHGAEFTTVYRWRQPLWGVELFHHGLMGTDGVTPSEGGRQFAQVIEEMKKLDLSRVPALAEDRGSVSADEIGLVFDFQQLWLYATLPQANRWHYPTFMVRWYTAMARLGLKVRLLRADGDWPADFRVIVAPGLQMVDDAVVGKMESYAQNGGHLVLTCRTALMDLNGKLREGLIAKPILALIGGTIDAYDGLPEGHFGRVEMDGQSYPWSVWGDQINAGPGTGVLARYADQFYKGAAAITRRATGRGAVTYCGVYGEQGLMDAVMTSVTNAAGMKTTVLPARVHVLKRGPYRILLNYQDQPVDAPAPAEVKFVVGDRQVAPASVAIWEE